MNDTVIESKQKLVQDFNAVVADTEKLLAELAASSAPKAAELRVSAEKSIELARERLRELEDGTLERARAAAKATDGYVHAKPWQSVGIAAAAGGLAGFVLGILVTRR